MCIDPWVTSMVEFATSHSLQSRACFEVQAAPVHLPSLPINPQQPYGVLSCCDPISQLPSKDSTSSYLQSCSLSQETTKEFTPHQVSWFNTSQVLIDYTLIPIKSGLYPSDNHDNACPFLLTVSLHCQADSWICSFSSNESQGLNR